MTVKEYGRSMEDLLDNARADRIEVPFEGRMHTLDALWTGNDAIILPTSVLPERMTVFEAKVLARRQFHLREMASVDFEDALSR